MSTSSAPHLRLLQSLLAPAIRLCLRRSIMFYDFVEIAKRAFVEIAEEELQRNQTKVNASRVNLLTGIYRHDIARIARTREAPLPQRQSLLATVIGHWEQSAKFKTKRGQPRVLTSPVGELEHQPRHGAARIRAKWIGSERSARRKIAAYRTAGSGKRRPATRTVISRSDRSGNCGRG